MSAPEAAVLAAAEAMHGLTGAGPWAALDERAREYRVLEARAAIDAGAPHIRAQTADLIADGMQAWAGDSERAYVQGFAEAAWGKAAK